MPAAPTILVADDHPLFREALKGAVSKLLPQARLVESDSADALFASAERRLLWTEGNGHIITVDYGHQAIFAAVRDWLSSFVSPS